MRPKSRNIYIRNGWQPLGGVSVSISSNNQMWTSYAQALVK